MLNKPSLLFAGVVLATLVGGVPAASAQVPLPTPVPGAAPAAVDDHADEHAGPGDDHAAGEAHEAGDQGAAGDHGEGAHGAAEHHEESLWSWLARVANFAILAGGLFYFLREPVARHLANRDAQIRGDLQRAAAMKADASARLSEIEQRLAGLPAELELVKQRGAEEVAAEEARIAQRAEVERERLVAQARREIEQQTRTARQALRVHAATLVIGVAESRLRATLTESEQQRLADTFTQQIGSAQ